MEVSELFATAQRTAVIKLRQSTGVTFVSGFRPNPFVYLAGRHSTSEYCKDWDLRVMDEKSTDRKARAEQFRDEACAAMQMAEAAANEAARVEYLRIAMQWLKLANEIDQIHGSSTCN